MTKKILKGVITSAKNNKTVVVEGCDTEKEYEKKNEKYTYFVWGVFIL